MMKGALESLGRKGRAILFATVAAGIGSAYFLVPGLDPAGRTGDEAPQRPGIPPIDRSAHGATETTAFGMG